MSSTATENPPCVDHCGLPPALPTILLESELQFYGGHKWSLNPCPTISEAVQRLREQLSAVQSVNQGWQRAEVTNNILLLSCAISNAVDDYLRGTSFELPAIARSLPLARASLRAVEWLQAAWQRINLSALRQWRGQWENVSIQLLSALITPNRLQAPIADVVPQVFGALAHRLPRQLSAERIRIPSAFRGQDLTHFDVLQLGRKFVAGFPDRGQALLLLGLRTAGSYFVPVLRAYLRRLMI